MRNQNVINELFIKCPKTGDHQWVDKKDVQLYHVTYQGLTEVAFAIRCPCQNIHKIKLDEFSL